AKQTAGLIRSLDTAAPATQPPEGFGSQATGLASLITALAAATKQGDGITDARAAIAEYVGKQNIETLQREITGLRQDKVQGGGEMVTLLQTLATLGIIGGGESLSDQIKTLKDNGIIPSAPAQPRSLKTELMEAFALVDLIRPPQAQTPASMIRFADGAMTISDFLQLEDFKAKQRERLDDREDSRERIKAGREAMNHIAAAVSDLAESKRSGKGAGGAAAKGGKRTYDVACDYCQVENRLTIDVAAPPEEFTCTACKGVNSLSYGRLRRRRES
ncbi:MAG: hypothetical protein Q8R28_12435, partial [Dehalococcoidia bacterium]|nr:hypothetical protein [Dehalococcoidia bacterium]